MKYLLLTLACLVHCNTVALAQSKLAVATLHPMLTDLAQQVGGAHVTVRSILPPGTDVHTFNPSPAQVKEISTCRLVLASGKHLESYLEKMKDNLGSGTSIVEVGRTIPSLIINANDSAFVCCPAHAAGALDPHWWNSLENMRRATEVVASEFAKADPAHTDDYQTNAKTYRTTLEELKKWAKKEISQIPNNQRIIPTAHLALSYFAKEFGFKLLPIQGLSTQTQASSQEVAEAVSKIKSTGVPVIFQETGTNSKHLEEIIRETGVKKGGELIADGNGTGARLGFVASFRHNITTLVTGLTKSNQP
jgi:zinc/manganese transport system substrate-binding protein